MFGIRLFDSIWWGPSSCTFDGNLFGSFGGETYADIDRLYPLTVRYVPFTQREHNNSFASTESW